MTTAQLNTIQSSTEVSVEIIDGKPTTTSIDVAAHFGKRHDAVLRAIRELECSPEFNAHNFVEVEYLDAKGERRPQFRMTRDGFTFLCMGFTGMANKLAETSQQARDLLGYLTSHAVRTPYAQKFTH